MILYHNLMTLFLQKPFYPM